METTFSKSKSRSGICLIVIILLVAAVFIGAILATYYATKLEAEQEMNKAPNPATVPPVTAPSVSHGSVGTPVTHGTVVTHSPTAPMTTPKPKVTNLRLNRTVTPKHYNVEVKPLIYPDLSPSENFTFEGKVNIRIYVHEETNVITLHSINMTVTEKTTKLEDDSGKEVELENLTYDEERQFLHLVFKSQLVKGKEYNLFMEFVGTHKHKDLYGFYLGQYKEKNVTKYLVTSQFQRTHARRVFPCFDEPSFKATFDIILVRRNNFSSISNTVIRRTEKRGTDFTADIYESTPIMSSYLVAMVVSEYQSLNCSSTTLGTTIKHWARPNFVKYLEYSCTVTTTILEFFENYTGIPYPMKHLDQVAVIETNFSSGAMENWGMVTYRESILLWNREFSSTYDKYRIASVVAHELGHFWWGDLVTCAWWDDTFLNEAFASWSEYLAIPVAEPSWDIQQRYSRDNMAIMRSDDRLKTQPIFVEGLEHHNDLMKAFDSITYVKGAGVLRMFQHFFNETNWQSAMHKYLTDHSYQNVVHQDLFNALHKEITLNKFPDFGTKANATTVMGSWILQANHPIVNINISTGMVQQKMYLYDHLGEKVNSSVSNRQTWQIPLQYVTGANYDEEITKWIYDANEESLNLTDGTIVANDNGWTFLRVNYGDDWKKILQVMLDPTKTFKSQTRAHVLDDSFRLARAGYHSEVLGLAMTASLENQIDYIAFYPALDASNGGLQFIYRMFSSDYTMHPLFMNYFEKIFTNSMKHINWERADDKADLAKQDLSAMLVREYCANFRMKDCVDTAVESFRNWTISGDKPSTDILYGTVCTAVRSGSTEEYDFVESKFHEDRKIQDDEWIVFEDINLRNALACTEKYWLIDRTIALAEKEGSTALLQVLAANPVARNTVQRHIVENWHNITDSINKLSVLSSISSWIKTDTEKNSFASLKSRLSMNETEVKRMDDIIENVSENVEWVRINYASIKDFLTCFQKEDAYKCYNKVKTSKFSVLY